MKKILYLILLLPLTLACSKYSWDGEPDNRLKGMDLTDLHFLSDGGTRSFAIEDGSGAISATSNETWCKTSVSGNTVSVNAEVNQGQTGRIATLTLKRGNLSTVVGVVQSGHIFQLEKTSVAAPFAASTHSVGFTTSYPATATTTASWIKNIAITDNSVVTFDVERNLYKQAARTGTVNITSNDVIRTINVSQPVGGLLYNDYLGKYTMSYATANAAGTARTQSIPVELVQAVAGSTYYLKGYLGADYESKGNVTVRYTESGPTLNAQIIYAEPNVNHWIMSHTTDNFVSTTTTTGLMANNVVADLGAGTLSFEWVDNGKYEGKTIAGMVFYRHSGSGFLGWDYIGAGGSRAFYYPLMTKVVDPAP